VPCQIKGFPKKLNLLTAAGYSFHVFSSSANDSDGRRFGEGNVERAFAGSRICRAIWKTRLCHDD
jgi:hypothetical protein